MTPVAAPGSQRMLYVLGLVATVAACQTAPQPAEEASPRRRLPASAAAAVPPPVRCAAGQLCERAEPLLGLRLPTACELRVERPTVFVCVLRQLKLAELDAFYTSRGSHVVRVSRGLTVRPRALQPGEPAERLPLLVVEAAGEDLVLTGTAPARSAVDTKAE